jgi:hypothetical protein
MLATAHFREHSNLLVGSKRRITAVTLPATVTDGITALARGSGAAIAPPRAMTMSAPVSTTRSVTSFWSDIGIIQRRIGLPTVAGKTMTG